MARDVKQELKNAIAQMRGVTADRVQIVKCVESYDIDRDVTKIRAEVVFEVPAK